MGLGIPSFVKKAVDQVGDAGRSVAGGAKKVVATGAATAKAVGSGAVEVAKDSVSFSAEVLEAGTRGGARLGKDFAGGVVDSVKNTGTTLLGVATHPLATAKAVGNLATNPVLNPMAAPARLLVGAAQGKSPVEVYQEGAQQLKGTAEGIAGSWKQAYKDHGVGGVLGFAAPDVAAALLTGGGSAAAKVGGTAAVQAVGKEVLEGSAREVAEQAVKSSGKTVAADALKRSGREVVQSNVSPSNVSDNARKAEENGGAPDQNWLEAFVGNFSLAGLQ
ncbi:hypothetical protein ABS71_00755 [bacterium SCN 62-11]|nr:MAG: hypothetical protein ABS71_00755 [bacterium SCN 62-11]